MRKISFKSATALIVSCLIGALVLVGIKYLLTNADVHNRFWYSFSKAMVITVVLAFNNLIFGTSAGENKRRKLFLSMALAIVLITAIDLLIGNYAGL